MRYWILAALPLAVAGGLLHESGEAAASAARRFDVAGFRAIDLRGSDDVEVVTGPRFEVVAQGDPAVLDRLEIAKHGDTLRIGRKRSWFPSGSPRGAARVRVTMPRLAEATVAGSGSLRADRAQGGFEGSVAGSGNLRIAAIQGGAAKFSIAGSGNVIAGGRADAIEVSIAGSGDLDGRALKALRGDVSILGSGSVHTNVAGPVEVSLVGSGDAVIGGGARCHVSKMGSGTARCS